MALAAPSSTLTGQTIADSYDQVLFLDSAAGVTEATLKIVSGTAGKTALSISDEHVLVKGVDTNNAAGFEVQQTDGTSILKVAAGTPSVLVSGSGVKLYFSDAGGEYISGDGTDLTIAAGTALNITADVIDLSDATKDVTLNAAVDALNFDSNTLSIDASNNRVGIGTASPSAELEIDSAGKTRIVIGNNGSDLSTVDLCRSDTSIGSGNDLGAITFSGEDNTGNVRTAHAMILGESDGTHSAGDNPTRISLWTTPSGSSTITERMRIDSSGNVGIGDTDPSEAKLSIDNVAADDIGLKIVQSQAVQGVVIEQNGNNQALKIDTAATTNHGLYFDAPATTTGNVINVADADSLTSGTLARFHSNSDDNTARNLVNIINNHADSTGATCLFIDQDSDASGIVIDTEATTDPALYINVPQHTTGNVIQVANANSLDTGSVLAIEANGDNNDNDNSVVKIAQESASADKTVGILIKQQGDDASIELTGTGGGGIKFSMGTDPDTTGTATGNTLDDYEEGTWDAVVKDDSDRAMTMDEDTGYYTKVGNLVHVSGYFTTNSLGSASGNIRIYGLPFTVANDSAALSGGCAAWGAGFDIDPIYPVSYRGIENSTYLRLQVWDVTTGVSDMQASEWTADGKIMLGFSYRAG